MRCRAWATLAIGCVLLAGACDSLGEDEPSDLGTSLRNREFLSESVEGRTLVPGTEIRLGFTGGELNASAGCNHFSGPYRIEGNVLKLDGLGGTEIGCDAELHAQDQWIADLLIASPTIELEEPRLTLSTQGLRVTLLDRSLASPDRPLVGTHWIGNGHGDGSAVTFGPGSAATTLLFDSDSHVEIFTACQKGSGTFSADTTTITFEDLAYDDNACTNTALAETSTQVQFILNGERISYEIKEANLTLTRAGHQLMYRADE